MEDQRRANAVRHRFATGQIPKLNPPLNEFGGPSQGQTCMGCAEGIASGSLEIEVLDANSRLFYFHPKCHVAFMTLQLGDGKVA